VFIGALLPTSGDFFHYDAEHHYKLVLGIIRVRDHD
jgi:hypothetical protein